MDNEARLHLRVTGEQQAERELDKLGDAAAKTGDRIADVGEASVETAKATDKAGDSFKETAKDTKFLTDKVGELSKTYDDLLRKLNSTGDTSLEKDINRAKRELRKYERFAKDLLPDTPAIAEAGTQAGAGFGERLVDSAAKAIASGNPYVIGAVTGIAIASAPAVGSILAAAVVGGVGAGGIVGGVALAAKDPRVATTAAEVGKKLLEGLQDSARPFVDPVLQALDRAGSSNVAANLAPGFAKLADSVVPVADSLLRFSDALSGDVSYALGKAGPLVEVIAASLPRLGDALGNVITVLASDTDGAAAGVEMLVGGLAILIETAGGVIYVLSKTYEGLVDLGEALNWIQPKMQLMPATFNKTADAEANLVKHTEKAEAALLEFDSAMRKVFGQTLDVREATIGYEQAIDDLVDELTTGKRTLDETTQAGRDNWTAINDTARAIENLREANIDNGMAMDEANAKYDKQLEQLRKTLLNLGYNKAEVNKYINELKKVPTRAQTEIHLKGIKAALADIRTLAGAIGAITGYAVVNVATNLGHRAGGGAALPNHDYIVGENGPELLRMGASGGHVYNSGHTNAMLSGASGGSHGSVSVAAIPAQTGSSVLDALLNYLVTQVRFEIRTTANGDSQEYFS